MKEYTRQEVVAKALELLDSDRDYFEWACGADPMRPRTHKVTPREVWQHAYSAARYELSGRMVRDELEHIDSEMLLAAY